jgi:ketosteroid isomerase-like protein
MSEATLQSFIESCHEALTRQSQGDPDPLLGLWSRADDISIMAAVNGYQVGFEKVSDILRWASQSQHFDGWSAENLVTVEGTDMGCSIELEHYVLATDDGDGGMTLRATQVYRREAGGWRIIHRHGDALTAVEVNW